MGSNTENVMKNLSKAAALQKEYANHCIRTTCINLLDQCGFQGRHIKTISGHKSEELLTSYCYDTSDNQKKSMSIVLNSCTHFGRKSAALGSAQQNPRCIPSVAQLPLDIFPPVCQQNENNMSMDSSAPAVAMCNTAAYNQSGPLVQMPEDFDILDLPDNVLVQYAETMERTYTPRNVPNKYHFFWLYCKLQLL